MEQSALGGLALFAEELAPPLQALEGEPQSLLALAEELDQALRVPAQRPAQRANTPAQPLGALGVGLVQQEVGVDAGPQRGLELAALVLGAAERLGGLAIEGIEAQRAAEFFGGAVEVAAAIEHPAVQLVRRRIGDVLGLGDLQALDGAPVFPLLGVEVRQAEKVRRVDGVAPRLLAHHQAGVALAARAVLGLQAAQLGERHLEAEVLGIELQRELEQLGGLVVHAAVGEPAGQLCQLLDVERGNRGLAHRTRRFSRKTGRV